MLVHKFYLVECIQVEFKFELNSNRFEWKQESESVIPVVSLFSVIPSFLSVIPSVLSHPLYSQSFLLFSVILVLSSVIPSFSVNPPARLLLCFPSPPAGLPVAARGPALLRAPSPCAVPEPAPWPAPELPLASRSRSAWIESSRNDSGKGGVPLPD
jgi:hypothetical protein